MDIILKQVAGELACDQCSVVLQPLLDGWLQCPKCEYCFLLCGDEGQV